MNSTTRYGQLTLTALVAALSISVALLAWPRVQAAIRFVPVERAIDAYFANREIPTKRMLTLLGFAEEAIDLHDHYRYHDGLSFLYYLRGLDVYTPALERREAYRRAESEAIEVVRRAPAQPEAWLRIALVRSLLRDEAAEVIEPWKMSIFTGRTHSTLLVPRAGVGLLYLDEMNPEARSMLRDQLLLAWSLKPRELVQELRTRDPRLIRTRDLLAGTDPDALSTMEAQLEIAR